MNTASTLGLVLLLASAGARAVPSEPELIGSWRFVAMVHEGQRMPPRDPRLDLRYEFASDGTSRLAWSYDAWVSRCERRGEYFVEGAELVDHATWLNPANRDECAQDADMQLDKTTRVPWRMLAGHLQIDIVFGEGWLSYEWERAPPAP